MCNIIGGHNGVRMMNKMFYQQSRNYYDLTYHLLSILRLVNPFWRIVMSNWLSLTNTTS